MFRAKTAVVETVEELTYDEARRELKSLLKSLHADQRELKRKLSQNHAEVGWETVSSLMGKKEAQRVEITVLLNLYHELRGKACRHNIKEADMWFANRYDQQYRSKYVSNVQRI